MTNAQKENNPHSPYSRDPQKICESSIELYAEAARKFLEGDSIMTFEYGFELAGIDEMEEKSIEELEDLIDDLKTFKNHIKDFIEEHDLPEDWTVTEIQDNEGKFCINEEVYEDAHEYINAEFLDWGYHRCHGDINVIQFLTHFGGPAGGFWIHSDGTMEYWTAWWSSPTSVEVRGEDYKTLFSFFSQYLECAQYEFSDCPYDLFNCEGEGLEGALEVLKAVEASKEYEVDEDSEEDSE